MQASTRSSGNTWRTGKALGAVLAPLAVAAALLVSVPQTEAARSVQSDARSGVAGQPVDDALPGAAAQPAGDGHALTGSSAGAGLPAGSDGSVPQAAPGGAFRAANLHALEAAARGESPAAPQGAPPAEPGLVVDLSVAQAVRPGALLRFTLRYTNSTGANLTNAVILNTLSSGQYFDGTYHADPAIPAERYTWDNEREMSWTIPAIPAGTAGLIQFETNVLDRPEPSAQQPVKFVGSTARIHADGTPEHEDEAVSRIVGPILELTLADGPDPVLPGRELGYTLTLRNIDRADAIPATGIVISAVIPSEIVFLDASPGGAHDSALGHVVWNVPGPLEAGDELVVSYRGHLDENLVAPRVINVDPDEIVARSAELKVNDVTGRSRVGTSVDALLQKEAAGPRTIVRGATAFPGDVVTYTVSVHNPRPVPLGGVVLTDTLPGEPGPFEFRAMLEGPAPSVDGAKLRWDGLTLPPWGSVRMSYTAYVPKNTFIQDNTTVGTMYGSSLSAFSPDFGFIPASNVGQVRIYPPVTMNLVVKPDKVQAGEEVVYTITLESKAPYPVSSIRLTNTMTGPLFRFTGMRLGPQPEAGTDTNPVGWTGLYLPAGGKIEMSYAAVAIGFPLVAYPSVLTAESPETSIPKRTNVGRVTIDSPFRIAKTVTPKAAVLDTDVRYDLTLTNVTTMTWILDTVTDTLAAGMFDKATGRRAAVMVNEPPAQVRPGEVWQGSFEAYVSGDTECRLLPRSVPNVRGAIEMEFSSPIRAVFANASDLAPLRIKPHVSVYVTPTRQSVLAGMETVYNVRLANESTIPGVNTDVKLTIPENFTYLRHVDGAEPTVTGRELTWRDLQLAPHSDTWLRFAVKVHDTLGSFGSDFDATAEGVFCVQRLRNQGRVDIREDVVKLETRPLAALVPPGGLVDLELKFQNFDQGEFVLSEVVNTLPPGFEFVSMVGVAGGDPVVDGSRLTWAGVVLPGKSLTSWRMRVRAATLFGAYQNRLEATTAEMPIRAAVSTAIEVTPMIQITKDASTAVAHPDETFVYTVTLINWSSGNYANVEVTDSLPPGIVYERMILGPAPLELGANRMTPVWRNLTISANGGNRTLAFEVRVDPGAAEGTVFNHVDGHSPDVVIPSSDGIAPVFISRGGIPAPPPTSTPRPGNETPIPTQTGSTPVATRPSDTPIPSGPVVATIHIPAVHRP